MFQRIISMFLSVCLLLTSMPLRVLAETMPEEPVTAEVQETSVTEAAELTEPAETTEVTEPSESTAVSEATEPAAAPETVPAATGSVQETEPAAISVQTAESEPAPVETDFTYTVETDGEGKQTVTITGYTGSETELIIPDAIGELPVTKLADSAFYDRKDITAITIPGTIETLGRQSFNYCYNLEEVTLSEGIKGLGYYSFSNCFKLKRVAVPESVTDMGNGTFTNCTLLEEITLPEGLTGLGENLFYSCQSLTEINLPESLESIGDWAFCASGLIQVSLPDSLTTLGRGAFNSCQNLTSAVIPAGITELSDGTFRDCKKLSSITLPDTMTALGESSLLGCIALTELKLPAGLTTIGAYSLENLGVTELVIPQGVTTIGNGAFQFSAKLQKVTLPAALTSLGDNAFTKCYALSDITLPEGLTNLGSSAFSHCTALKSITIPAKVGRLNSSIFYSCTSLESVTISEGIVSLGTSNFYYCSGLESIVIPKSVQDMGYGAFLHCSSLTDVTLPEGLANLGKSTFSYCSSLAEIDLPESLTSLGESVFCGTGLVSIEIPETVTDLGEYAFSDCHSLQSIVIPEGVTELKGYVFSDCSALENITFPSSLTTLGPGAFLGCKGLKTIELPASLKSVGHVAFESTGLTEITIPEGVTTIAEAAFQFSHDLKKVEIPATVTSIGSYAFKECKSLTDIELPEQLTEIGCNIFEDCIALTTIAIPDNFKTLPQGMFDGCTALNEITLPEGLETIESYAFINCVSLAQVVLPESLKTIRYGAFWNCNSLKDITLPANLTVLESCVFVNCASLEGIVIPNGVADLGDRCFDDCTSLQQVTLSANLTRLGSVVFSGCTSLERIVIPSSVTRIEYGAFQDCSNLKFVKIGYGVEFIDGAAFDRCSPELTLEVWAGTYAEQYAIEKNINYTLAGNSAAVVVTLNPEVYRGMQLVMTSGNLRRVLRVQEQSEYRFTGIQDGNDAQLQVINAYGDVVETHTITRIYEETTLALNGGAAIAALTLKLLDENGNDVSAQASADWYHGENDLYTTGLSLSGLPVGKVLRGRIRLTEAYGKTYYLPEEIRHTVAAGSNALEVTLERIPLVEIMGTVTDGVSPISGASVTVSQTVNGKYIQQITAVTDGQGQFLLEIPALDAEATVSALGYEDQTLTLTDLSEGKNLGTVALKAITGTVITVAAERLSRVRPGGKPEVQTITTLKNMAFSAYNKTRDVKVDSILVQGMALILMDHSAPGEELEITVTSLDREFQPTSGTLTVGEDNSAAWTAELKEAGSIEAEIVSTKNEKIQMLVYNEAGKLTDASEAPGSQTLLETGALADGSYTVVLMSKTSLLAAPALLGDLALLELVEKQDYVSHTVVVRAGEITQCRFATVPVLDESRFCYTDPNATSFAASKTTLTSGQYFTLRASADFAAEYRSQVSDVKWVFQLPEEMEYYDGTLSVNNNTEVSYEITDNALVIPTEDPTEIVRFCVYALEEGEYAATAYLEFTYEGRTIRQSIGTAAVKVGMLDFKVTGKTFHPRILLIGTAGSNSQILIYDNDILVDTVRADTEGDWKKYIELRNTDTYTTHDIQAVMKLPSGTLVYGKTHTVTYQYSPKPVTMLSASMYPFPDPKEIVVGCGFVTWENGEPNYDNVTSGYTATMHTVCTFVALFECEDISRLSDVSVEVPLSNGETRQLPMALDEDYEGKANTYRFVASETFLSSAVPKNMAISYVYDQELVFSDEHLAKLRQETAEAQAALAEIAELREQNGGKLFRQLPMDEEIISGMPEDLLQLGREYNEAVMEYDRIEAEMTELMATAFGETSQTDTSFSTKGKYFDIEARQRNLPDVSLADMVVAGYDVYQVGADETALILMRIGANEATGRYERSLIDLTSGDLNSLATATFYALDEARIAELVEEDVHKSGTEYFDSSFVDESTEDAFEKDMTRLKVCLEQAVAVLETMGQKRQQILTRLTGGAEFAASTAAGYSGNMSAKSGARSWTAYLPALDPTGVASRLSSFFPWIDSLEKAGHFRRLYEETGRQEYKDAWHAYRSDFGVGTLTTFGPSLIGGLIAGPVGIGVGILLSLMMTPINQLSNENAKDKGRIANRVSTEMYPGKDFVVKIDPSGYIYEAVPSNRLEGVTVTCYEKVTKYDMYDEPYEEIVFWDAQEFEQVNPLSTDALGRYAWDVPEGWWQVKAELDGYETAYSEWLPVPPPQLEVNLGLTSYAVPEISDVFARPNSVEVEFSRYMRAETLTGQNITVSVNGEPVTGEIELLNGEESPAVPGQMLASRIRFVPAESLEMGAVVTVTATEQLLSYADVAAKNGDSKEAAVVLVPESLFAPESVQLLFKDTAVVAIQALPAAAAAGETVQVKSLSDMFLTVEEETVTLDENGCGLIHIRGVLPGETALQLSMCDGRIQTMVWVKIRMAGSEDSSGKITLNQDYLAMEPGETAQLTAEVLPAALENTLCWSVEAGSETKVAVDASGKVTALNEGIAYVLATVANGETRLTARCRIDVAEDIEITGVRLNTTGVTTELFSSDYAEFDLLLELPQNYSQSSADGRRTPEKNSVAILDAWFTDSAAKAAFHLIPLDDRRIAVVPTEEALKNPAALAKSYSSTVKVKAGGKEHTTEEMLTVTLKQSLPKLKATVDPFNSFYPGQIRKIHVTGGTVTGITLDPDKTQPDWLDLQGETLVLNEKASAKNSGKVFLLVKTQEWTIPVETVLTVKNTYKEPVLKLSAKTVTLNAAAMDSVVVTVTANPGDYDLSALDYRLTDSTGTVDKTGEVSVAYENGRFTIGATDRTKDSYKLHISTQGSKETVLTIKTMDKEPTVSFKVSGNPDLSIPTQRAVITPSFKNYSGTFTLVPVESEQFRITQTGSTISVRCKEGTAPGAYTVRLKLTLADESSLENDVKITVKQTALKLKLSASKLTLNKAYEGKDSVAVNSATKGYTLGTPVWDLMDKTGKNSAAGRLDITYAKGKLTVSVNDSTEEGATYRILVRAGENHPAQTLTVTIPAWNKSAVTSTLKANGGMDVIRDGSSITLIPTYRNLGDLTEKEETLVFCKTVGKEQVDVSDLFAYSKNADGSFRVTKAEGAELDHSARYTVKLVTVIDGVQAAESKPASLGVKMGSAKLTLSAGDTTLFAKDKNDRVTFRMDSADTALNDIETVTVKDAKYADKLEVLDYGNGEYALGFKDGKVHDDLVGRKLTVNLNVFLEGNQTDKANATVKLKLQVLQ